MAITQPKPGRGAWTRVGGLLPAKPGSTNRAGYYRAARPGEREIGLDYAQGRDKSHAARVVHLGVKAIQMRLEVRVNGIWGPSTSRAAMDFQRNHALVPDGIIGPLTVFELFKSELVQVATEHQVPSAVLAGLLGNESNFDPAAVGVNGLDHGLAQINLGVHEVSVEQALDVTYALAWSAKDLRRVYEAWELRVPLGVDPWSIAIANHNSPALARRWALEGKAPIVEGRVFQIGDYVKRVWEHPAAQALA